MKNDTYNQRCFQWHFGDYYTHYTAKITFHMVNDAIFYPHQVKICNVLWVPRSSPINFLTNKSGISCLRWDISPYAIRIPTTHSLKLFWPSKLVRSPDFPMWISDLVTNSAPHYLFVLSPLNLQSNYDPSLLGSHLFKSHFRLSNTQISKLPKKHATYLSYA